MTSSDSNYNYYSIDDEIKFYEMKIKMISVVLEKFPDAAKKQFKDSPYENNLGFGDFYSPSIVDDEDLKLDFYGKWYSLTVTPYVEVPFGDKKIKVYNSISKFDFWKDKFGIEVKENPEVRWNNNDKLMLKLGYKQKTIKSVYDKILEKLSEHPVTHKGYSVKLIQDDLPEYIKKYLILL